MEIDQIIGTAIFSAQTYYRYLERNGLGVQVVDVNELVNEGSFYKVKLSNKLFDIDQISFEIKKKMYTTHQIAPLEYDYDDNILIFQPIPGYQSVMRNIDHDDIKVISDLKFLVKRVENWYKENGALLNFPFQKSTLAPEITIFDDRIPTVEQAQAISLIFQEPFSYIWGAPGTGKTRFVLAYSILSYIQANKRVAVFAPTNNALEQVLYGVLEMIKYAGFRTDCLIRLGTPSKKFAQEYPEVCEVIGINKKISELQGQLKIYNKVEKLRAFQYRLKTLKSEIIPKVEYVVFLNIESQKISEDITRLNEQLKIKQRIHGGVHADALQLINRLDQLTKQRSSSTFKIISFFSQDMKINIQENYDSLFSQLQEKNNELEKLEYALSELSNLKKLKKKQVDESINNIDLIETIKYLANISPEVSAHVRDLSFWNSENILNSLKQQVLSGELFWQEQEKIYEDYLGLSQEEVNEKIAYINKQIEELYSQSTKKKLRTVNVIASTIDTYIGRFQYDKATMDEENIFIERLPLDVDHIFMDEAGYCNLIKGTTLLANKCPITFLRDHMQLPPVCEMNDARINQAENNSIVLWAQSALMIEDLFHKLMINLLQDYNSGEDPQFSILKKCDLTKTHHFGSRLSHILDQFVYHNGFDSSKQDDTFELEILHARKSIGERKRENPAEAQRIKEYMRIHHHDNCVILTPYKDQVNLLRKTIPIGKDNIMTVHSSQGREWDTVILRVSDTTDKWFTDSCNNESKGLRLINTAVSRAKKRLVIVCDFDYWIEQKQQLISHLITL